MNIKRVFILIAAAVLLTVLLTAYGLHLLSLEQLTLPKSVKYIGENALYDTNNISLIYNRTDEEFSAINKDPDWRGGSSVHIVTME